MGKLEKPLQILFFNCWKVSYLDNDSDELAASNKWIQGEEYWFFRHFPHRSIELQVRQINQISQNKSVEFKPGSNFLLKKLAALINVVRLLPLERKMDVIILWGHGGSAQLSLLKKLGLIKASIIVFDSQSFYIKDSKPKRSLKSLLIGALVKGSVDHILSFSQISCKLIKSVYDFPQEMFQFFKLSVECSYWKPGKNDVEGDYILVFGNPCRDWKTLFEAARMMPQTIEVVSTWFDNSEQQIPKNVRIINGLSMGELRERIRNSKFLVHPLVIRNYSYGQLSLLDAMAVGKANIVSRVPGIIDYVVVNKTALLAEPGDPSDLAAKIKRLWDDSDLRHRIAYNGRKYCLENHSDEYFAEQLYGVIYKSVKHR
jgi:glycosyltransferase involved in cell wall biosynthesis